MQIYLGESLVPELASLAKPARRAVRQRAVALLSEKTRWPARMPVLLCALGGLVGSFAGAYVGVALAGRFSPGDKLLWNVYGCLGGVGLCGAGGGFLGTAILLYRLRPYLQRVVLRDGAKLSTTD